MRHTGIGLWSKTGIGRHKSRTLPHIILNDSEWFYWAYHEGIFKGQIEAEAHLIYNYAKTIKLSGGVDLEQLRGKDEKIKKLCEEWFKKPFPKYVDAVNAERFFANPKNFSYQAKQGTGRTKRKRYK